MAKSVSVAASVNAVSVSTVSVGVAKFANVQAFAVEVIAAGDSAVTTHDRARATLNVPEGMALPTYRELAKWLTANPVEGITFLDFRDAALCEWDTRYLTKGEVDRDQLVGVELLRKLGIPSMYALHHVPAAEKQSVIQGRQEYADMWQAAKDVASKFISGRWTTVRNARNVKPKRVTLPKDIETTLRECSVERLPHKVAALMLNNFEVDKFWQNLAATIVKAKRVKDVQLKD
jgi:hypothetical protein